MVRSLHMHKLSNSSAKSACDACTCPIITIMSDRPMDLATPCGVAENSLDIEEPNS